MPKPTIIGKWHQFSDHKVDTPIPLMQRFIASVKWGRRFAAWLSSAWPT